MIKPYYNDQETGITIYNDDCFNVLPMLTEKFDLILTDMPYHTTACKWDKNPIDLNKLWEELSLISKDNTTYVFTASQPFTSKLVMSNLEWFKYEWIWEKTRFSNQMLAKKQPLKIHENILVFSKGKINYNPQGLIRVNKITKQGKKITDNVGGGERPMEYFQEFSHYPKSIQIIKNETGFHPTQKPVALMEYLIETYTNKEDTIIDPFIGSGTTLVAAKRLGRRSCGIEISKEYCDIAIDRLKHTQKRMDIFEESQ